MDGTYERLLSTLTIVFYDHMRGHVSDDTCAIYPHCEGTRADGILILLYVKRALPVPSVFVRQWYQTIVDPSYFRLTGDSFPAGVG